MDWKPERYLSFGLWLYHEINSRSTKHKDRIGAFGRRCGISRAQLYRYFAGKRHPSKQAMSRMAKALDIKLKIKEQKRRRNYGK
jgi:hypothetical protein